jgi:hypothetical protein
MKPVNKILIALLIISGLMPSVACLFAGANQGKLMEMFHLTSAPTPDLEKTIVIMGAALLFAVIMHFLAASWIWVGQIYGLFLSCWIGITMILASAYMLVFFSQHNIDDSSLYIIDLVKGGLIFGLSVYAIKKAKTA